MNNIGGREKKKRRDGKKTSVVGGKLKGGDNTTGKAFSKKTNRGWEGKTARPKTKNEKPDQVVPRKTGMKGKKKEKSGINWNSLEGILSWARGMKK